MRFARFKALDWGNALRLGVAFLLPVAAGTAAGAAGQGFFCGAGAFLVANADPGGRYDQRLRATSIAFLACLGTLVLACALQPVRPALVLAGVGVLAAGTLTAATGPVGARIGLLSAIAFIIGAGLPGGIDTLSGLIPAFLAGGAFGVVLSVAGAVRGLVVGYVVFRSWARDALSARVAALLRADATWVRAAVGRLAAPVGGARGPDRANQSARRAVEAAGVSLQAVVAQTMADPPQRRGPVAAARDVQDANAALVQAIDGISWPGGAGLRLDAVNAASDAFSGRLSRLADLAGTPDREPATEDAAPMDVLKPFADLARLLTEQRAANPGADRAAGADAEPVRRDLFAAVLAARELTRTDQAVDRLSVAVHDFSLVARPDTVGIAHPGPGDAPREAPVALT